MVRPRAPHSPLRAALAHVLLAAVMLGAAQGCVLTNVYPPLDPENTAQRCANGVDDDLDGAADCESDGCRALGVCVETDPRGCTNGLDDDGDALLDARDPGCFHLAPPSTTRCASSSGTSLDSSVRGIESLGLSGDLPFEPSLLEHEGRRVLTARTVGGRMFLLAPLTGALDGLTLRFDVLHREDDAVTASLVPASAVDASSGWDGFGAFVTAALTERTYTAAIQVLGGRFDQTALPRSIGPDPRWLTFSLRLHRASARGDLVADLEVLDAMGMRVVTASSSTTAAPAEDTTLYLVLDVTPSPRFPDRVIQLDNLSITRTSHDPCGAPVPVADGPRSIAGAVRTPRGVCVLGIDADGNGLAAYRLEGARLVDTSERITLTGSRPGRVALEHDAEAGVIRAVAAGHDTALFDRSILARLHTLRARPDCTGWIEERVDDTPDGRRPSHVAIALSGEVLSVAGIHSSGRLAIERWQRDADGWTAEGRGLVPSIPGEPADLFDRSATALSARGEELVLVYQRAGSPENWLTTLPLRAQPNVWTPPIPWQAPSGEEGTFDATSVVGGALVLDPGRLHYFYDASYPVTTCTRCGVGFSWGSEAASAAPCGADAGPACRDAGP